MRNDANAPATGSKITSVPSSNGRGGRIRPVKAQPMLADRDGVGAIRPFAAVWQPLPKCCRLAAELMPCKSYNIRAEIL
jgi:hypothetical protein